MKYTHEFRTIAGLTSCTIDVTDETLKCLEKNGAPVELLGSLAKQKERLQAIFRSTLEIADKDIDKKTYETLRLTILTSLSEILDEYCQTVNTALPNMDTEHQDDILYLLGMTNRQSTTIKNKIGLK